MKKFINKRVIISVFFIFIFLFSLFRIGNVFANGTFTIEDAKIESKTGSTEAEILSFTNGNIKGNVTFHQLGDSVTYKIKLKNNDNKSYTINSINENNESANIVYEYANNKGIEIGANSSKYITIKATYKNELNDINKRLSESKVKFSITYVDENNKSKTSDITLINNPFTGDNIYIYIILLIVSILGILVFGFKLNIFKNKKAKRLSLMIIASIILLPIISKAYDIADGVTLENTYKIYDKIVVSYKVDNATYQKVIPYNSVFNVADPSKQGYVFDGWELTNGDDFDVNTKLTDDITLVATLKKLNSSIVITVTDEFEEKTLKEVSITYNLDNISSNDVLNEYSIDDGVTWTEYTAPIIIDENLTVQARTVVLSDNYVIGQGTKAVTKIIPGETNLKTGYDINNYILSLVNNRADIKSVKIATKEEFNNVKNALDESSIVSTSDSEQKTYLWTSLGDVYFYSKSEKIHMNENSSKLFLNFNELTDVDLSKFDTSNVTNMESMFEGCAKLEELDLSGFDTTNVTNMINMFAYDASLTSLNVSSFVTDNVKNMSGMFQGLTQVTSLNLSNFNTSNVFNMNSMFQWDSALTSLNISSFNTKKVTDMGSMFRGLSSITELNVSSFNTENVTDMSYMFTNCRALTSLNVTNFNTSKVQNMSFMFQWCGFQSINLSSFNTSQVTNMKNMLSSLSNVTELDLSNFNTTNVTVFDFMFSGSKKLTKIYTSNNFVIGTASTTSMFKDNIALVGGAGTEFDSSHIDGEYARIDGANPGYFSTKS